MGDNDWTNGPGAPTLKTPDAGMAVHVTAGPNLTHVAKAAVEWNEYRPLRIGDLRAFVKKAEAAGANDGTLVDIEMGDDELGTLFASMSVEVEVASKNLFRRITGKRK